jgi:WD40 repeat protein
MRPTRLGVLFAVLIGLGAGFWQWGQPPRPRVVLENPGIFLQFRSSPTFSPDGRMLATVHRKNDGWNDFYLVLWDLETEEKILDLLTGEWPGTPVFSPDCQTLACRFKNQIRLWDRSGNEVATYDDMGGRLVYCADRLLALRKDYVFWDVAANKAAKKMPQEEGEITPCDKLLVLQGKGDSVKVYDLVTARLCAEIKDLSGKDIDGLFRVELSQDRRFLILQTDLGAYHGIYIYDLITGKVQEIDDEDRTGIAMSPDSKTIALELYVIASGAPPEKSWWNQFMEWFGIQKTFAEERNVVLKTFPSKKETYVLKNCSCPVFSPDGTTLAVVGTDGKVQLWDLPIGKPIGKILGLAGVAAVATLLAFNGIGWLRRRRMRLKANLVPYPVPSTK